MINSTTNKHRISIIGGGAAGLFLACKLDPEKFEVIIYEKNAALGRKFLVAGKGGFNLTHSESKEKFAEKYHPQNFIKDVFYAYDNSYFINWLNEIGIETVIGSSKRVFPKKDIKPIEVLNAIEKVLKKNKVQIKFGHEWKGWDKDGYLKVEKREVVLSLRAIAKQSHVLGDCFVVPPPVAAGGLPKVMRNNEIAIFALGGSSWKVTGSDGTWLKHFEEMGIKTIPFQASNCAFKVEWEKDVLKKLEGKALKNVVFSCAESGNAPSLNVLHGAPSLNVPHGAPSLKLRRTKGEAVITEFGIEGSGVYPLSGAVREGLAKNGRAIIFIDLKPDLNQEFILEQLKNKGELTLKDLLVSKIKLSDTAFQLIKLTTTKEEYQSPEFISQRIKNFPITITALAPIDEAISTVGGIPFEELNSNFELKKTPNTFCIGEMVDWDAPTGGYLLQMCFSMGCYLAEKLNEK